MSTFTLILVIWGALGALSFLGILAWEIVQGIRNDTFLDMAEDWLDQPLWRRPPLLVGALIGALLLGGLLAALSLIAGPLTAPIYFSEMELSPGDITATYSFDASSSNSYGASHSGASSHAHHGGFDHGGSFGGGHH